MKKIFFITLCILLMFAAAAAEEEEECRVTIDPIPDQNIGTNVIITGSVYPPQEGTFLVWIQPVWFDHNIAPDPALPHSSLKSVQIQVPERTGTTYYWNISLDTETFQPDAYRVEAAGIDY